MKRTCRPFSPEYFWSRVDKTGDCWLWTGARFPNNYGHVMIRRKNLLTHRVAYELTTGLLIPPRLYVCHHCDNPPCVRPDHLFLGTQKENLQDALRKGRLANGELNPNSRLTITEVREVRRLASEGLMQRTIATQLNMSRTTVSEIVRRKRWGHLTDEHPEGATDETTD